MYSAIGVGKLNETQKRKLCNGHPVRIKKGSVHSLHLTDAQIKKLESEEKKGAAYTLTIHPEQSEKYGAGFFGDIATKAKTFVKKHKDLINPIFGRVRTGSHSGIDKLSAKTRKKIDEIIKPIEGEGVKRCRGRPKKVTGVIGDVLKGIVNVTDLGVVKPKRVRKGKGVIGDVLKNLIGSTGLGVVKPKRVRKGKGVLSNIVKTVAPASIDSMTSGTTSATKDKVNGMGAKKRKVGRPRKGRGGGTLFAAGNYGPSD